MCISAKIGNGITNLLPSHLGGGGGGGPKKIPMLTFDATENLEPESPAL